MIIRKPPFLLMLLLTAATLSGCCGMTNIQASGGGAGGLVSLGALMVGSSTMQKLCEPESDPKPQEVPSPPETDEGEPDKTGNTHQRNTNTAT